MTEILAEIVALMERKALNQDDGWLRAVEIERELGISEKSTMKFLHQLKDSGRLEMQYIHIRGIHGRLSQVPAYRLKENDKPS